MNLPELTLPQMLRQRAQRDARRVAIRQKDFGIWKPVTWAQYYERAAHFGQGLLQLGLPAGGHVGVIAENRIEWVLAQMGAGLAGGITVGVYPTSPTAEVAYVVGHADIDIMVCEDQEQTDKVLDALGELPRLKKIIVMETKGLRSFAPEHRALITTFGEVERLGAGVHSQALIDELLARQKLDDVGLMIYTSGSTGKPKGAMVSWRNMRGVAPGIIERLRLDAGTTHLSYLPLCHVAEQMLTTFCPVYLGSTVNFGESIRTVQEDLREVAPTMFLGVPRIWEKLHSAITIKMQETGPLRRHLFRRAMAACAPLAEKPRGQWTPGERLRHALHYWLVLRALQNFIGLRDARVALTGAAPIAPDVVRFFRTLGVPLIEVYGLTESTGMVTGHDLDHVSVGTVGPVTEGVEYRVADSGELQIRGEMVFAGYYKNPEATATSIVDGWLHTGDVVREESGQIRIVDRLKDIMITAGGKNLTPSEIENTMKASPYIKECVIVAEGRKFVGALVMIDYETVGKWAEARRIAFTHFRSLVETPEVRGLIDAEIARGNARLAQVAQIRKFHLLPKELDHDDGEVTATMKVRRSSIYKAYAAEIEALYS
ncbi:long-chain-fatty-acid--CoA ligase [Alicycliphilus denitrificans]|uniref:AMP-dependent synthetase/ligase n=1 Tax=Alicycliphilus denitrificans TaxID=179636 RepID=UPI00095D45A1|nr:AMP-binding protein [Alicycliphilus denitrificans]MBN9574025.1 AMP-binding protein [Alicycliphilus denitrificans]OJW89037.1 MAG: long-chain fatty acid--CoA ligase [Alicycliphilus sp. 69-12]BCN40810.1 long-chain-fatty-acid--CoA ligase [Alicycliphilus denitrificans]